MTRNLTRNSALSVVAPLIAILTLLIAAAVLAQVTGADRRFAKHTGVSEQHDPDAERQALDHALPRNAGSAGLTGAGILSVSKFALVANQHADAPSGDAPAPVPLINLPLVPDAVAPGAPAFTLTVNGTGFVSSSVVNWNGSPRATTFVTSSQLTAKIAASDVATAGTVSVSVVSPAPGGGKSNVVFFPVTPNTGDTALFNQGA